MLKKGFMLLMVVIMCNGVATEKCEQLVETWELFFCDQIAFQHALTDLVNGREPDQTVLSKNHERDVSDLIGNAKKLCFELNDDDSCYEKVGLMTFNVLYDQANGQSLSYDKYNTCLKKCNHEIQDKAKDLFHFLKGSS
tara:strand:+ start:374 stop:790 length:417 start_codon:yes stop_codon:yes gene_type:complete